ncbi:MAG: hypothetical protein L0323_08000 [Planctomycetes bacterium]|nr:hypothetical protein [Planctomycetota bacterium]
MSERVPLRVAGVVSGLLLFVLALQMLRRGAAGLDPLFETLRIRGVAGAAALGWIAACLLLSGSPVAALALGLLDAGTLDAAECLAMICGSRLGAATVILGLGLLADLGRKGSRSSYVGVTTVLATAAVYFPATALALLLLRTGSLETLSLPKGAAYDLLDGVFEPVLSLVPFRGLGLFLLGIGGILGAFRLIDRALPEPSPGGLLGRVSEVAFRPTVMFGLGLLVTALSLSVSVSLGILLPLTAKGSIRRENLLPYVLGANISTFIDTLFASLLVRSQEAFPVVLAEMLSVAGVSLALLLLVYRRFARGVDRAASWLSAGRARLLALAASCLACPLLLFLLA